jgi:hypothetical protein
LKSLKRKDIENGGFDYRHKTKEKESQFLKDSGSQTTLETGFFETSSKFYILYFSRISKNNKRFSDIFLSYPNPIFFENFECHPIDSFSSFRCDSQPNWEAQMV